MPGRKSRRRVSSTARAGSEKRRQQRLVYGGLGIAAIVAVVAAIVFAAGGGGATTAPNFSFTLYQGVGDLGYRDLDLDRLRGEPVVLNFWAGQCPPCRAEMPQFQLFYNEFQDQVKLVGVDIRPFMRLGTHRDAEDLLRELGITYPAGLTDGGSVPRKYGIVGMPTTVFIKPNGEIFEKRTGALDRNSLVRLTNALLREEASEFASSLNPG